VRKAFLLATSIFWLASQAVAGVKVGDVMNHEGVCEPSGAVALPEGTFGRMFVVAEDEHNILRVYRADRGGPPLPVPSGDLNKHLLLDPDEENDKADFEAATWLNGKAFWIGSHSRSGKGQAS
jgi:hypothetical protein